VSPPSPDFERLFLDHLKLIERVVGFVCRRYVCRPEEVEEFRATVHLELIKNDYARLRAWEGRSALATFLTVIVRRLFQDYLIHLRGKRRTSEEARRLGPVAEKLEELLRDVTLHEACEILLNNFKVDHTRAELEEMAARLPQRTARRMEGEEQLAALPSPEPLPDELLRGQEGRRLRNDIQIALERVRARLPTEDRLLLKMHYEDGFNLAQIARKTCQDQKPLYPRRERLLKTLRQELERDGIRWEDIAEAFRGASKDGLESV
jgi:RNA polymerase sigma factor (sigma-70 family)